VYFLSQAAARAMIAARERDPERPRGKIVNIGSLAGAFALPNISTYGASRTGILGLTRAMAVEWSAHVGVNVLAPGYVRTGQTEALFQDPAWVARTLAKVPVGRFCETDDLTGAALLLAADVSDYITGQVVYVDGGWLAAG
jgi:NAD(P)-dependent dehydrogenase (short-subunit alcohol dehydrogenase family)